VPILSVQALNRATPQKIVVDTNIVRSYLDTRNTFHRTVSDAIHDLVRFGYEFYYFFPTLFELQQYWRSRLFMECVDGRISDGFWFYAEFKKAYDRTRLESTDLGDDKFKMLRKTLSPIMKGAGDQLWLELCKEAFEGRFEVLDQDLRNLCISFADVGHGSLFPPETQEDWPSPTGASALIERFGLGSRDATILHYANAAHGVTGLLSNDKDFLFAAKYGGFKSSLNFVTFLPV
jgi:predicted nucleic acid-binding protein